jgi:hypothetical protein
MYSHNDPFGRTKTRCSLLVVSVHWARAASADVGSYTGIEYGTVVRYKSRGKLRVFCIFDFDLEHRHDVQGERGVNTT